MRIWGEIAKLNVAECEVSNWIAKINVAKSLKIWPNANIYVANSNVHMPKLPRNLSSYIYGISSLERYFHTYTSKQWEFGVSFSTTANLFLYFSLVKEDNEKMKKKNQNIQIKKQNRKNLCRKIHFFRAPIRKHLCRILLYTY